MRKFDFRCRSDEDSGWWVCDDHPGLDLCWEAVADLLGVECRDGAEMQLELYNSEEDGSICVEFDADYEHAYIGPEEYQVSFVGSTTVFLCKLKPPLKCWVRAREVK